jgi:hypothetical protein
MRVISAVVTNLLSKQASEYFFLVTLAGTNHFTSLPYDITMSDGITYLANNGLVAVDPPRMSQTVDREAYKIQFADPLFAMKGYFETGAVGDSVVVRVGFCNPHRAGNITGSDGVVVKPGEAFRDIRDTILSYKGTVDGHGYEIEFDNGTVMATIEGSSPMSDLDLVIPFMTSKDAIKQYDATDTAYDQIYEGSGEIMTKWGKA